MTENENALVDVSILHEVAGGDKSFINRTINVFLKNMSYNLSRIRQGVNNQDWNEVYIAAHSAKSSLSIIRVVEMLDWIIQLEENAKNKVNLERVPGLVKKIEERYFFAEEILNEKLKAKDDIL